MLPKAQDACEMYRNGAFHAALTFVHTLDGWCVVALHTGGEPTRYSYRDADSARLMWGMCRLTLKVRGFERVKPEVRAA